MSEPERIDSPGTVAAPPSGTPAAPPFQLSLVRGRERVWLVVFLAAGALAFSIFVFAALIGVVGYFGDLILILLLAWLLYFMLSPVIRGLEGAPDRRMPRFVAVLITYGIVVLVILTAGLLLAQSLATSLVDFIDFLPRLDDELPALLQPVIDWLAAIGVQIDIGQLAAELESYLETLAAALLGPVQDLAFAGLGVLGNTLFVFVLSIYLALDTDRIEAFLRWVLPGRLSQEYDLLQRSASRSFGGFVRGQLVMGLALGAVALVTSLILGLEFAPLTSVVTGILHAIPFFGPFISWLPPVAVAIFTKPEAILPALLIMGAGWFLTMNVLQPRLMSGSVGIHPIVVLLSVLIGNKIAGIPGAIFGIPIAAVISAFFFYFMRSIRGEPPGSMATVPIGMGREIPSAAAAVTVAAAAADAAPGPAPTD
jgi:predicted PurR-regulated permease PerM